MNGLNGIETHLLHELALVMDAELVLLVRHQLEDHLQLLVSNAAFLQRHSYEYEYEYPL